MRGGRGLTPLSLAVDVVTAAVVQPAVGAAFQVALTKLSRCCDDTVQKVAVRGALRRVDLRQANSAAGAGVAHRW